MFGLYEMVGLLGLGPSRNELRASPLAILTQLPWILPAAICISIAWFLGLRAWLDKKSKRIWVGVAIAVAVPVLILGLVGWVADFRVLGRHFSPAIPAILLPLAGCLSNRVVTPRACAIGWIAVVLSLSSAIMLRFMEKHERDDYRTATAVALEALGANKVVIWQADFVTPCYYAYRQGGWPFVQAVQKLRPFTASGYLMADVVMVNRADVRCQGVDYQKDLKSAGFELKRVIPGFEVWRSRY